MTSGIETNLESYFVARVHVNPFMVAMKQPAILHMVWGEGWDSGPSSVDELATPFAAAARAFTDPFIAMTTICRPRSPLNYESLGREILGAAALSMRIGPVLRICIQGLNSTIER